jgi:hypothetical protein
MEEEYGILNIEVAYCKTDPDVIKKLFKRLHEEKPDAYSDEKKVRTLMRYNVWTIDQFKDVSGLSVSTITNLARPNFIQNKTGTKLDTCFPFPDSDGRGPKFVVRNAKSEAYIKV